MKIVVLTYSWTTNCPKNE